MRIDLTNELSFLSTYQFSTINDSIKLVIIIINFFFVYTNLIILFHICFTKLSSLFTLFDFKFNELNYFFVDF